MGSIANRLTKALSHNGCNLLDDIIDSVCEHRAANHILHRAVDGIREVGKGEHLKLTDVIQAKPIPKALSVSETKKVETPPGQEPGEM